MSRENAMLQVAHHYELFDGVSPINEQNRKLIAALKAELETNGPHLPIYWGNRNWHPLLPDTLQQMANDGIKHALAFVTVSLQFVFELPAVSTKHHRCSIDSWTKHPAGRQASRVLQSSTLY